MTEQTHVPAGPRVLGAGHGRIVPSVGRVSNRFMIDGAEAGGRFALVQHLFEPNALAAPMHRHHDEDEYTYVLSGRIGAVLGDDEVVGGPGDLIFKPRGQWHTFWNAGDEPAAVLEIISPAGLEELFRSFGGFTTPPDPQTLVAMAAKYRCDLDFDATFPIVGRHGLVF
jgi:mannose-6-phosphate isomerase-like protein (cupin superfamily)